MKDITQDILRISSPLDYFGNIEEDLSHLPNNIYQVYYYGLGGLSIVAEIFLLISIPLTLMREKYQKLDKWIYTAIIYLSCFFAFAVFLDPNYSSKPYMQDIASTVLGVVIGGVITLLIAKWEIDRKVRINYVSILKAVFSEFQDNERVLRTGETFTLNINHKHYKPQLVLLNKSVLSGTLGSETIGLHANHKLISSLVTVERRVAIHNQIVGDILAMISGSRFNTSSQIKAFEWLYNNLKTKHEILIDDFTSMIEVISIEIGNHSSETEFKKFCSVNKLVESKLHQDS